MTANEPSISEEDYWYVVRHAEKGWAYLYHAVTALEQIAEQGGDCKCAKMARKARYELPRGYIHTDESIEL